MLDEEVRVAVVGKLQPHRVTAFACVEARALYSRIVSSTLRSPVATEPFLDEGRRCHLVAQMCAFSSCRYAGRLLPPSPRHHFATSRHHPYELVGDARSSFLVSRNPCQRIVCSWDVDSSVAFWDLRASCELRADVLTVHLNT